MDEFQESIKLRNLYKALRKCCAGSMWKDGTALGLELNPKSQMIPLRNGFTFLKWHFTLTPTGKVILRAAHGVAAEEKRRLRRMMKQVHAGKASLESVQAHYRGWRAHMEIGNTRELLRGMDKYFAALIAAENKESEGEP